MYGPSLIDPFILICICNMILDSCSLIYHIYMQLLSSSSSVTTAPHKACIKAQCSVATKILSFNCPYNSHKVKPLQSHSKQQQSQAPSSLKSPQTVTNSNALCTVILLLCPTRTTTKTTILKMPGLALITSYCADPELIEELYLYIGYWEVSLYYN